MAYNATLPRDLADNPIHSSSEEWGMLEHYLMLCASTSRARILQAWHISPTHVAEIFEQQSQNKQRLLCWVDVATLNNENDLQNILRRVPKLGMKFVFGSLILPGLPFFSSPNGEDLQAFFTLGDRRIIQFLVCEVAVGNSYPVESEHDVPQAALVMPPEFDSIIIRRANGPGEVHGSYGPQYTYHFPTGGPPVYSNAVAGVLPSRTMRYHYVVFHSSQVCPRYCIQVEIDPSAPELFAIPLCMNCNDRPASIWCTADKAGICDECDTQLHESSSLAARHVRIPLHERPRPNGRCFHHPSETPTAFCSTCRTPACRLCLPSHNHTFAFPSGMGPSQDQNDDGSVKELDPPSLMPLAPAYWALAATYPIRSASGEELTQTVQRRLQNLTELKLLIKENLQRVERSLFGALDAALTQLVDQITQKVTLLHGCQLETERRLEETQWSREFLRYLCSVLPPQDFLVAWLAHQRMTRNAFMQTSEAVELDDAKLGILTLADLQIEGQIDLRAI